MNLYCLPDIKSRRVRRARHADHIVEIRNEQNILIGKLKVKTLLRKDVCWWEEVIKMNIKEMRCECGLDSSGLGQKPVAGSCECDSECRVPQKAGNFFTNSTTISFPRRTLHHGVRYLDERNGCK
jgi:hypothetical protein